MPPLIRVPQANVEGLVRLAAHYESPLMLAVCGDWLASPAARLSARPGSPAFAWRWLVIADRVGLSQLVDRWGAKRWRAGSCQLSGGSGPASTWLCRHSVLLTSSCHSGSGPNAMIAA